jgi:urate oxidase
MIIPCAPGVAQCAETASHGLPLYLSHRARSARRQPARVTFDVTHQGSSSSHRRIVRSKPSARVPKLRRRRGTVRDMPRLGASSQGESRLRMLRIVRRGDRHDTRDLTVSLRFEGDFATAFLEGQPGGVIPGEALKSLVYGVAREHAGAEIESFGLALCRQLLDTHRRVSRVRVEVAEQPWMRTVIGGKAQGQSFILGGPEQRTATVTSNGDQTAVVAGIEQLVLMRTAGFLATPQGRRSDDGSEDAVQPLLVGSLFARWTYANPEVTFGPYRQGVRLAITDTFAMHAARSVQYTLYAIADVILATYDEILDVTVGFQERPYRPADLFRAQTGMDHPDELFVAAEAPLGIVEVTVERDRIART